MGRSKKSSRKAWELWELALVHKALFMGKTNFETAWLLRSAGSHRSYSAVGSVLFKIRNNQEPVESLLSGTGLKLGGDVDMLRFVEERPELQRLIDNNFKVPRRHRRRKPSRKDKVSKSQLVLNTETTGEDVELRVVLPQAKYNMLSTMAKFAGQDVEQLASNIVQGEMAALETRLTGVR